MITEQAAHIAEKKTQAILKATVVAPRVQSAASRETGEELAQEFASSGAITPLYDPKSLCLILEHSNSLRQNIDAYATNIDGFGHRFEPAIDFDAEDADERVAETIVLERMAAAERGKVLSDAIDEPTADEIAARRAELVRLARAEKARLESFFEFACFDHSFVELRRRTRQDVEVTGNAFWEILRNNRGDIARLVHVPSHTMRLLPLDAEVVEVEEGVRVSPVEYEMLTVPRRFRRFIQIEGMERVYFKSFGDSRVMSKTTGKIFLDVATLLKERPDDAPATEIIHFAIHSPRSPYGAPRWIGTLLSVLGSREMEEVNYLYFNNKSVPPLALIVSGGRFDGASVSRIERFIEDNLKGKENWNRILVLESDADASTGENRAKIELHPLTGAQQQDATFSQYDERNVDKVGSSFRLPRLLRGESKDFNRSVAESTLRFAEDQVFQPERDEFDYLMNRKLLADMGIRFWRFRSQTPSTRDPERLTAMVERLVRVGVLTPEEGRLLANDIFNREFRKIHDDWVKQPITLTLAGLQNQHLNREEAANDRDGVSEQTFSLAAKSSVEQDVVRIVVPRAEFESWFKKRERDGSN